MEDYVIEDAAIDMDDINSEDGEVSDNADNHDSEDPGEMIVSDSEGIEVVQVDSPDEFEDEDNTTCRSQLRPGLSSARPPVNSHQNRFEAEYNYVNIGPKRKLKVQWCNSKKSKRPRSALIKEGNMSEFVHVIFT